MTLQISQHVTQVCLSHLDQTRNMHMIGESVYFKHGIWIGRCADISHGQARKLPSGARDSQQGEAGSQLIFGNVLDLESALLA